MVTHIAPLKPEAKIVAFNPQVSPKPAYGDLSTSLAVVQHTQHNVQKSIAKRVAAAKKTLPSQLQSEQQLFVFQSNTQPDFVPVAQPLLNTSKQADAAALEIALFEKAMIEEIVGLYLARQQGEIDPSDMALAQTALQDHIALILQDEAKKNGRILIPNAAQKLAAETLLQIDTPELPVVLHALQTQNQTKIDTLVEKAIKPQLAAGSDGTEPPQDNKLNKKSTDALDDTALAKTDDKNLTTEQKAKKFHLSEKVFMKLKVDKGAAFDGRKLLTGFQNNKQDIAKDDIQGIQQAAKEEIGVAAAHDITKRLDPITQQSFDHVKAIIDKMVRFENANGTTLTSVQQNKADLQTEKLATEVFKGTAKPVAGLTAA